VWQTECIYLFITLSERIMSQGKLNVFICLLHCKIESCHKVNWMYLFVSYIVSLHCDMILSYLQYKRQINTFSLPCDMILFYNVIDECIYMSVTL
jgi:hypothetical protein